MFSGGGVNIRWLLKIFAQNVGADSCQGIAQIFKQPSTADCKKTCFGTL